MNNEKTASDLNDLLEYLHDSRNGYKECAENISDPSLQELFNHFAKNRQEMIVELEKEVDAEGVRPTQFGSVTGVMHRLFVDLKSLFTGGDAQPIVNEIKRGESMLIARYKEVLAAQEHNLPASAVLMLRHQLKSIQDNLSQVETLVTQEEA